MSARNDPSYFVGEMPTNRTLDKNNRKVFSSEFNPEIKIQVPKYKNILNIAFVLLVENQNFFLKLMQLQTSRRKGVCYFSIT